MPAYTTLLSLQYKQILNVLVSNNLFIKGYLLQDSSHQISTNTTSTCLSKFVGKQTIQAAFTSQNLTFINKITAMCQKCSLIHLPPILIWKMATSMHGRHVSHRVSLYMYSVKVALLIIFTPNTQCISHSHPQPAMEHIHIGSCSQFLFTAVDTWHILMVASP